MTEFYVIEPVDNLFSTKWAYGTDVAPVNLGKYEQCPVCGRAVGARKWLPPYRATLSSANPKKWGDFLWVAGVFLTVSQRFIEMYNKEKLTGIKSFDGPLEIVRYGTKKAGDFPIPTPAYYFINFSWGGANQDDTASGSVYQEEICDTCDYCRMQGILEYQPRIVIGENSWNGDDFFRPRGGRVFLMGSEKFKKVSDKYTFTNLWLIPASLYGYDTEKFGLWYIDKNEPGGEELAKLYKRSGMGSDT